MLSMELQVRLDCAGQLPLKLMCVGHYDMREVDYHHHLPSSFFPRGRGFTAQPAGRLRLRSPAAAALAPARRRGTRPGLGGCAMAAAQGHAVAEGRSVATV